MGDTTWVQIHTDESNCPGDPDMGHGGEATGGPDGSETWCLEGNGGAGDSCGTLPPWDVKCLWHEDRHAKSSDLDINYWHVDQYRADQSPYTGSFSLWCGSGSQWDGTDVECGTWYSPPGYGNDWRCIAELTLPALFSYAEGCTLQFDARYDLECNCDLMYCEYYNGETWERLAQFTSTSNNTGGSCGTTPAPTTDYFGNNDNHDFAGWQSRTVTGSPAFSEFISGEDLANARGFGWIQVTTGDRAPHKLDHDMAYDSARGIAVMFGGWEDDDAQPSDHTYEWDDSTWTRIYPATSPDGRVGHQLVYFPDSSHAVLFGGYDGDDYLRDTWVWDGTNWKEKTPAHRPARRWGHGMTYDSARGVIVMFGGEDALDRFDDTWEWNGVDWTEITTIDSPDARVIRGANGLAYDPVRAVTVLFGGETSARRERDTWEYNGLNWTEASAGAIRPDGRYRHGLAYHPDLGGVVMHGGAGPGVARYDTWLWNGITWTELHPAGAGTPISHAMIYDYSTGLLTLQGGSLNGSDGRRETYELRWGEPLRLRWRFVSDELASDADYLNTDGGAWIDNVRVDNSDQVFTEDFETYPLDPEHWSFPEPDGLMDGWYMVRDPDPAYEGGDGGYPASCATDSSIVYRGRPELGYPAGAPWRNGWYYALVTPAVPLLNTGCAVQYDRHYCALDYSCDRVDTEVRFYDAARGTWCPWINMDGAVLVGNCSVWDLDVTEDVSAFYGAGQDSMQFAWILIDQSHEGDFCRGKHLHTDLNIDNMSVGFFDGHATQFIARQADMLHDTFETGICGYNSYFDAYNPDTLSHYSGGTPLPWRQQFVFDVIERDGITTVELEGSINSGGMWVGTTVTLAEAHDPADPDGGGVYYGTFCPADFGLSDWDVATDLWYYVKVTDDLAQAEYFPATADPLHPGHTGAAADYFDFSVLPHYPPGYESPKLLLVDGYRSNAHDASPCLGTGPVPILLADLYAEVLDEAGYTYDRYDILGSGGAAHLHPVDYDDYDAIVWFTGLAPASIYYAYDHLFDKPAQEGIRDYLGAGGKAVICGDLISWIMAPWGDGGIGCDSLGGEFLSGVLGSEFIEMMDEPIEKPMLIFAPEESVSVFGVNTAVNVDTLRLYRECPDFRVMTWVETEAAPPAGYTAQPLLAVANPDVAAADAGVYVEYLGAGQCVFFNFDLTGTGYCDVNTFADVWEDGRVDLMRTVLEDIFGLPADYSGVGDRPDLPDGTALKWALHQNMPNPARGHTEIRYEVGCTADVRISVYTATGRLVKTLASGRAEPGTYSVVWDGRNSGGLSVAGGIYFYKMEAGAFGATRKMLLMR